MCIVAARDAETERMRRTQQAKLHPRQQLTASLRSCCCLTTVAEVCLASQLTSENTRLASRRGATAISSLFTLNMLAAPSRTFCGFVRLNSLDVLNTRYKISFFYHLFMVRKTVSRAPPAGPFKTLGNLPLRHHVYIHIHTYIHSRLRPFLCGFYLTT